MSGNKVKKIQLKQLIKEIHPSVITAEKDMINGMADQLREMKKDIEKEYGKFNDKKVLAKISKYTSDALMALYNLGDYIEENIKYSDREK
jgi:hypothetical protein